MLDLLLLKAFSVYLFESIYIFLSRNEMSLVYLQLLVTYPFQHTEILFFL